MNCCSNVPDRASKDAEEDGDNTEEAEAAGSGREEGNKKNPSSLPLPLPLSSSPHCHHTHQNDHHCPQGKESAEAGQAGSEKKESRGGGKYLGKYLRNCLSNILTNFLANRFNIFETNSHLQLVKYFTQIIL